MANNHSFWRKSIRFIIQMSLTPGWT